MKQYLHVKKKDHAKNQLQKYMENIQKTVEKENDSKTILKRI